jgi:hypothetical protein
MKINVLAQSIVGFSMILAGCTAIFTGVAGGYRSPLVPADEPAPTQLRVVNSAPPPVTIAATSTPAGE